MNADQGPHRSSPREDLLVSLCFADLEPTPETFATLRATMACIDARFRFRELALIIDSANQEAFLPLLRDVANVRLFSVRPGVGHYERRVIAAEEAIGDVVVLASIEEVAQVDLVAIIEHAAAVDCVVLVMPPAAGAINLGLSTAVVALGRAAGFNVNLRNLKTVGFSRAQLDQLLSHSDPELALRFPPLDWRVPLAVLETGHVTGRDLGLRKIGRRLQLAQKLLVYMAPGLLVVVSFVAALLALLGVGFSLYVLGALLLLDNLAPGWLTTSTILSLTSILLGTAILGLSLGLQQLLRQQGRNKLYNVAAEVNRTDLFGQLANDLNVERRNDEVTGLTRTPVHVPGPDQP
jgi:hypothetical protein